MNAIAKTARVSRALQVLENMHSGMTVVDACEDVGLPRSSFYDIVKKNSEAIVDIQEVVEQNARQQLTLILFNKTSILEKLIDDGLSAETKPRDRLAIYNS